MNSALACACTLGFASAARADFAGPVIAILDGDTIDVLIDRQPVRVRLAQIDAPEKRQAFGTRARQALASMVFQQSVKVIDTGRDRYGRVLGTVFVSGKNINAAMVEQVELFLSEGPYNPPVTFGDYRLSIAETPDVEIGQIIAGGAFGLSAYDVIYECRDYTLTLMSDETEETAMRRVIPSLLYALADDTD